MSILWTIIIGFVAGVIAKFLHPGNKYEPSGFIVTTLLGIVGAFAATYLGQAIGWRNHNPDSVGGDRSSDSADLGRVASHIAIIRFAARPAWLRGGV